MKYTPLPEVMEGKRVLLVDDSIVRATTLRELLILLKTRGRAKEIHIRIACPPIIAPCFYGIDMSTVSELFASKFMTGKVPTAEDEQAMADYIGATSLRYLPVEALASCVGLPESSLCLACVNTVYPTPAGESMYQRRSIKPHARTPQKSTAASPNAHHSGPNEFIFKSWLGIFYRNRVGQPYSPELAHRYADNWFACRQHFLCLILHFLTANVLNGTPLIPKQFQKRKTKIFQILGIRTCRNNLVHTEFRTANLRDSNSVNFWNPVLTSHGRGRNEEDVFTQYCAFWVACMRL